MNNTTQQFLIKFPKCLNLPRAEDENVTKTALTVIYSSLIPIIVCANLLLIFGIIKTKRANFSSSQIMFLILFLSDLTTGILQLPTEIYIKWKSSYRTCLEIKLAQFYWEFPTCMSGNLLFLISIDRYIYVVHNMFHTFHNTFHTRFVKKKILTTIITVTILISIMWSVSDILLSNDPDKSKVKKLYIALTVYVGTLIVTGVAVNLALLRNVEQKFKNLSVRRQAHDSSLTKTITIIAAIMVICYVPLMISLATFALIKDQEQIKSTARVFTWTFLPPQINAVLNSVVYLARNSRTRRYCFKLLNCEGTKIKSQVTVSTLPETTHQSDSLL